jgi:hypothetical protein
MLDNTAIYKNHWIWPSNIKAKIICMLSNLEVRDCMDAKVDIDAIYVPSEDVVVREIEGELIIVPMTSGIGDMEDALFTLNETGRAIMERLDGKRRLKDVVESLSKEYESSGRELEEDVMGFVEALFNRKILVQASGG